jgi:hypothetical protein
MSAPLQWPTTGLKLIIFFFIKFKPVTPWLWQIKKKTPGLLQI